MGSYDDRYPGRFIKAGRMHGKDVTLTIDRVEMEMLAGDKKPKPILYFVERDKYGQPFQYPLQKTNDQMIGAMFGGDDEAWHGKRVTWQQEKDTSNLSDSGFCMRVKGSPDIAGPVEVSIRLPQRKPQERVLVKTTVRGATADDNADLLGTRQE